MSKKLQNEFCESFYEQFKKNVDQWDMIPDGAHILTYYSGGKDSTVLLDLLVRAKDEGFRKFDLETLCVAWPRMVYQSKDEEQQKEMQVALDYWKDIRGIDIPIYDPPAEYQDAILYDKKNGPTPCYACEVTKTRILSDNFKNRGYKNIYISISHNSWDIGGYIDEMIWMAGDVGWKNLPKDSEDLYRLIHQAKRCYPVLKVENFTYLRPLVNFPTPDVIRYKNEMKFPLIPECCPEIGGADFRVYKRKIQEGFQIREDVWNERPISGRKRLDLHYEGMMEMARKLGVMPSPEELRDIPAEKLGI